MAQELGLPSGINKIDILKATAVRYWEDLGRRIKSGEGVSQRTKDNYMLQTAGGGPAWIKELKPEELARIKKARSFIEQHLQIFT